MKAGFTAEGLDNISVDDPRAGEFLALYLAALYVTGNLDLESHRCLGFVTCAMINCAGK